MKKLYFLLGLLCALCFVACSNFQLTGGDTGVVSLTLGDDLAREIRSAALRSTTGGSYTLTARIRGEYSDSQRVAVANGNYSDVTFTFKGIPVGKKIILDLTAKAGSNYIWYGNSGKHTVAQGKNSLNIALGRVSGVLMWNSSSVKIAPYGNYEAAENTSLSIQSAPVFCFDKNGNSYWYADGQNGAQRFDLQTDGSSISSYVFYSSPPFYAFTHDATTDILYGIGDGGSVKYWSGSESDSKEIMDSDGSSLSGADSLGFAVHDNIAYIANYAETQDGGEDAPILGVVQLSSYKLEDAPYGTKTATLFSDNKTFTLPEIFGSNRPSSQMIYHEGALYLLLRRVEISDASNASVGVPAKHFSIGALVKINPTTLSLDTSFGTGGYLGLSSMKKNFTDLLAKGGTSVAAVDFYGGGNDASTFYGPVGFVAIMPKKLVIADAGFSMEQEGTNVNLTKKTRVITVDLETLAFDSTDIDNGYYQDEIYGSFSNAGYSYIVIPD